MGDAGLGIMLSCPECAVPCTASDTLSIPSGQTDSDLAALQSRAPPAELARAAWARIAPMGSWPPSMPGSAAGSEPATDARVQRGQDRHVGWHCTALNPDREACLPSMASAGGTCQAGPAARRPSVSWGRSEGARLALVQCCSWHSHSAGLESGQAPSCAAPAAALAPRCSSSAARAARSS